PPLSGGPHDQSFDPEPIMVRSAASLIAAFLERSPRLCIFSAACAALLVVGPARADWPASGRALCTQPVEQFQPMITPDGSGGAIVAWGDFRQSSFWIY